MQDLGLDLSDSEDERRDIDIDSEGEDSRLSAGEDSRSFLLAALFSSIHFAMRKSSKMDPGGQKIPQLYVAEKSPVLRTFRKLPVGYLFRRPPMNHHKQHP